jgi:hypothetical protein
VSGFPRGVLAVGDVHANDDVAHEAMRDVARIYHALDAQGPGSPTITTPRPPPPVQPALPPAVYRLSSPLTGSVTLDGGGDAGSVWIFLTDSDLTTAANSAVVLINGATREHVFWLTHGSATLGAHSILVGNVVAASGITLGRGASLYGRAFARAGPIVLDTDLVSFCCDTVTLTGSQTFTASGGTAPYTFELFDGSLPSGVALRQTGPTTAELTGNAASSFSVIVAATDLHGCTGIRTVIVCPTITLPPLDAPSCTGYKQMLVPNGGTPPYSFHSDDRPSGLGLSDTGFLSDFPDALGCKTFTVTVTDANGCTGSRMYTVCTLPPRVLSAVLAGVPYSETVPISGTIVSVCGTVPGLLLFPTGLPSPGPLTISGTPLQTGHYTLTVTTVDADGVFTRQNLTLDVGLCPAITVPQPALPNGIVNVLYGVPLGSVKIEPSGGTRPYTFASIADPPGVAPGISLDTSGIASGKPTAAGSFSYLVSGIDALGCPFSATRSIFICPAVTLVPASLPDATVGGSYGAIVQALPAGSYTYTLASTPPGPFTITPSGPSAQISAMPSAPGQYQLTVTATDGNGCSGSRMYTVTVLPFACLALLSIAPSTLPNGTVGVPYSQPLTVIGGGTPPFLFLQPIGGSLPPGFALGSNGVITGTTAVRGNYCFTVTARDAHNCVAGPADYTIVIDPVSCPGATPITISPQGFPPGTTGVFYSQLLTASGGTPPYTFSVPPAQLPPGLTFVGGLLSGIPTQSGVYPYTLTVTDTNGCIATTACSMFMTVDIPALSGAALLLLAVALGAAGCIARRG